jgi:glycosyltransferase involved in cell wall biosynthesis
MVNPQVSIVVPVHNEEELLPTFIKDVTQAGRKLGLNYELILVENGSKDKTWQIIEMATGKNSAIRGVRLAKPSYGEAMFGGIKRATGKYVVIFNADYWEEKFLAVTQANLMGYDMVIGSKCLPGSKDMRHWSRRMITFGYNWFLKIILGYPGTDTHGIKVFNRAKVLPVVNKCLTRSGILDSEIMLRAYRENLRVLELPTTVFEVRPAVFGLKRIWQTPQDIWKLYEALKK